MSFKFSNQLYFSHGTMTSKLMHAKGSEPLLRLGFLGGSVVNLRRTSSDSELLCRRSVGGGPSLNAAEGLSSGGATAPRHV